MSYTTIEVDIDHGRVVARERGQLPETGHGLLTILEPSNGGTGAQSQLEAFELLQRSLRVDDVRAKAWLDAVRDARR